MTRAGCRHAVAMRKIAISTGLIVLLSPGGVGWAQEIPLPAADMARASNKGNLLIEMAELDMKPSFASPAHVRRNNTPSNPLADVTVCPANPAALVCARLNKSPSSKMVYDRA